jgi:hypothetical protein
MVIAFLPSTWFAASKIVLVEHDLLDGVGRTVVPRLVIVRKADADRLVDINLKHQVTFRFSGARRLGRSIGTNNP